LQRESLAGVFRVEALSRQSGLRTAVLANPGSHGEVSLFRMTTEIKKRAMRRAGVLMKQVEPAKNQHAKGGNQGAMTSRKAVAKQAGISRRQKD